MWQSRVDWQTNEWLKMIHWCNNVFLFLNQIPWAKRNDTKTEYGSTTKCSCFLLLQCKNMCHQRQNQTMYSTTCYDLLFLFLLENKWGKWVVWITEQLQYFTFDLCSFQICRLFGFLMILSILPSNAQSWLNLKLQLTLCSIFASICMLSRDKWLLVFL